MQDSVVQYIVGDLQKAVIFSGRSRRAEYWWYLLFYMIVTGLLSAIDRVVSVPGFIQWLITAGLWIPTLSTGWRRMHDVGKPGGFILIPIYSLILALTAGDVGTNAYGPDPKA
ncbi:aminopeptidase [Spirochaetia bacterium]|nr:aminopeptidase [Spirochaetia bacterium]GHU34203.1 aminopeptidase [Spirochaetia bacterium]